MPHLRQPLLVNRDKLPCRESSIFPDKQVSLAGKRKNGHRVSQSHTQCIDWLSYSTTAQKRAYEKPSFSCRGAAKSCVLHLRHGLFHSPATSVDCISFHIGFNYTFKQLWQMMVPSSGKYLTVCK